MSHVARCEAPPDELQRKPDRKRSSSDCFLAGRHDACEMARTVRRCFLVLCALLLRPWCFALTRLARSRRDIDINLPQLGVSTRSSFDAFGQGHPGQFMTRQKLETGRRAARWPKGQCLGKGIRSPLGRSLAWLQRLSTRLRQGPAGAEAIQVLACSESSTSLQRFRMTDCRVGSWS